MKNLKIGTRLGIAFAALLILMSVITGIGVWRLQSVGSLTDYMVNNALAKERLVNAFNKSIELNVGRIVAAAKNTDPVQQKFYKDQIIATIAKNNGYVKQMEEQIQDPEGKALLNEINEHRKLVIADNTAVFKEKDAGNEEGARKIVEEKLMPDSQRYLAAIEKLSTRQSDAITQLTGQVDGVFRTARTLMISLGLIALIGGIALAIFITRSITRPLVKAVDVASRVAQGDLGTQILVESRDETGQLMAALKDMNDNLRSITRPLVKAVDVASRVAQGDLGTQILVESRDETGQLMAALKDMNDNLVNIVGQVRTGTDTIATASAEIANG